MAFPIAVIDNAKNQTIIQGMLKGVICIHEKEIIHRDLKVFESCLLDC